MPMTEPECAALDTKIKSLESDYEALLAGRKTRVLVDQNGERIEFNAGDSRRLFVYIQSLKSIFATECALAPRAVSRPIRPFF